ncbi:MAG: hypothetical protein L0H64_00715 [Pseudonocardia sp.]|nr:hypothetical protein [Pseudonocardia sp.]
MPTDIHGVSGRAILEGLIAGQRSPTMLAELAKGRAWSRRADLREATDAIAGGAAGVDDDRSASTAASYARAAQRPCATPGGGPDSRAVIGEIGLDTSVFGTHQRLCS